MVPRLRLAKWFPGCGCGWARKVSRTGPASQLAPTSGDNAATKQREVAAAQSRQPGAHTRIAVDPHTPWQAVIPLGVHDGAGHDRIQGSLQMNIPAGGVRCPLRRHIDAHNAH